VTIPFSLVVVQFFNSLSFAMLLFLLALGLSLIIGVAHVINLGHGAFYLLGAYLGLTGQALFGSFWVTLIVVPVAVGLLGVAVERLFLRNLYGKPLDQALITLGLGFILSDLIRAGYGAGIRSVPPPAALSGPVEVAGFFYPAYQLFVLGLGLVVFLIARVLLQRTSWGIRIRAVTADADVAASLGIPPAKVSAVVFGVALGLAALGGVVGAPILALSPGLDAEMTLLALIVVVVGGLGHIEGSFWSAVLVGLVDGFARLFFPQVALFLIFALMALVLVIRPQGLLGRATA